MANRRLSMRKIKEVLRLKWGNDLGIRQIARSCSISHSTVRDYLLRAELTGLSWPLDPKQDDAAIENLLFPLIKKQRSDRGRMPNMEYLYREMKKKGVTLQLLWYEYKKDNPDGYQHSQFCHLYRQWVNKLDVTWEWRSKSVEYGGLKV